MLKFRKYLGNNFKRYTILSPSTVAVRVQVAEGSRGQ